MAEKKRAESAEKKIGFRISEEGLRVDRFLGDQLTGISRTQIEVFFREGRVLLNNRPCKKSEKPKIGDHIILNMPRIEAPIVPEPDADLFNQISLLYEDEWILAINKPSGISVHPGSGEREFTIADFFRQRYPDEAERFEDAERPGIVHRLDKDTSGILLLAKSPEAVEAMQDEFRERQINKTYLAWVDGKVQTPFRRISTPIIRHPRQRIRYTTARPDTPGAREALTELRLLGVRAGKSFLRIRLHTGRTHQIRVHMSSIGHPVCGDRLYGSPTVTPESDDPGIMLHAHELSFIHPYLECRVDLFAILPRRMRLFWQQPLS